MSRNKHRSQSPNSRSASGSSPPQNKRTVPPTPTISTYDPNWTKAQRQPWLDMIRPIIRKAIEDAYRTCPVRHVTELDAIAREAVEDATGCVIDETDRIGTGRQRNDNLADWVKARHTAEGRTVEWAIGDTGGYRIWTEIVGQINGASLVPHAHLISVVATMQRIYRAESRKLLLSVSSAGPAGSAGGKGVA